MSTMCIPHRFCDGGSKGNIPGMKNRVCLYKSWILDNFASTIATTLIHKNANNMIN